MQPLLHPRFVLATTIILEDLWCPAGALCRGVDNGIIESEHGQEVDEVAICTIRVIPGLVEVCDP